MKKVYLSLFAAALLFTSCEKDEPKDEKAPEITLSGLHESGLLVGEEVVQVMADDAGGIAKIDVFMGNDLISTLTDAPYEAAINSSAYTDGDYELKVVAEDKAGNVKEWKQSVKVSNVLMRIETEGLTLNEDYSYSLLVSDREGKAIKSSLIKKGETYEVKSPEKFYGKADFSLFQIYNYSSGKSLIINTLADVQRGMIIEWDKDEDSGQQVAGTYEVEVPSIEGGSLTAMGKDGSWKYIYSQEVQQLDAYENVFDVLFVKSPSSGSTENEPTYQLVEGVSVNSKLTVDYAAITTPFETKTFELPASEDVYMKANGFTSNGDRMNIKGSSDKLYFLPAAIFPEQGVSISLHEAADGNGHLMYKKTTSPADVKHETLSVTIDGKKTESGVEWNITGDEYSMHYLYLSGESAGNNISWFVGAPAQTSSVGFPELTEELQAWLQEFGSPFDINVRSGGAMKFLTGEQESWSTDMLEIFRDNENSVKNDMLGAWKSIGGSSGARLSGQRKSFIE